MALRRVLMRSERASGGESLANASRCARAAVSIFSGAMKSSGLPACGMMANASATGMCGISAPRMLNAHATESLKREDDRVLPVGLEPRLDVGDLVLRRPSRELQRLHADRAHGRRRALAPPQAVDEIARNGAQLDVFGLERGREPLDLADRVQLRVVAHGLPAAQVLAEPLARCRPRGSFETSIVAASTSARACTV